MFIFLIIISAFLLILVKYAILWSLVTEYIPPTPTYNESDIFSMYSIIISSITLWVLWPPVPQLMVGFFCSFCAYCIWVSVNYFIHWNWNTMHKNLLFSKSYCSTWVMYILYYYLFWNLVFSIEFRTFSKLITCANYAVWLFTHCNLISRVVQGHLLLENVCTVKPDWID